MFENDFNKFVSELKRADGIELIKEINDKSGVLRTYEFMMANYKIFIEYMDFGRSQTLLKFYSMEDDDPQKICSFTAIQEFLDKFHIDVVKFETYEDPDQEDKSQIDQNIIMIPLNYSRI